MIFILLIPAFCTCAWAIYNKYQQHKTTDMILLLLTAIAMTVNVCLVYKMMQVDLDPRSHLIQMAAASSIVPLLYTYFARQVGRQIPDKTAIAILWLLAAVTFIPEIIIYNPMAETLALPAEEIKPFSIVFVSGGHKLFGIHTGDLVAILQAMVTIARIIPFMLLLRQHKLHLNNNVYAIGTCWLLTIVFIIMVSGMSYEELRSTLGFYFYFISYSIIATFSNILIARGYDLYPIETDEGEVIEDLGRFVQEQYGEMGNRLRQMMEKEEMYLDAQLTADRVISELGTNRTYFSQLMSSEIGMSFSEYLNTLRLSHVERMLDDESLTISAIAMQSGFADAGYMTRKFKAKFGMTPTEWRKR